MALLISAVTLQMRHWDCAASRKLHNPMLKSVESLAFDSLVAIPSMDQAVIELVANSIDAGSKHVDVHVSFPESAIGVTDDGRGIPYADLRFVGTYHATSKDTREGLFRGRALACLGALAREMVVTTRTSDSRLSYQKIQNCSESEINHIGTGKVGTRICLTGLFYKVRVCDLDTDAHHTSSDASSYQLHF